MGFGVQVDIGEQQDIRFGVDALYLSHNLEGGGSLDNVFRYEGGKMPAADLVESLLLAPGRMDIISSFLEELL